MFSEITGTPADHASKKIFGNPSEFEVLIKAFDFAISLIVSL